jgi:hypothetical protein
MNTMDLLSKKRQVILDEIQVQQEMLVYWGHLVETKKNIELRISELESSLQELIRIMDKNNATDNQSVSIISENNS